MLANEAVHNMFSLVNPTMIMQVKTEDLTIDQLNEKSNCWRFLFYLGFWKKLTYIADSMSSLKLCYTTGDLQNFKIVYLLNYRSELTNEKIKEFSEDTSGQWIGDQVRKGSELEVLCKKVLLEEIISEEGIHTECHDPDLQLNVQLNKWICEFEKDFMSDKDYDEICRIIYQAADKLDKMMGIKNSLNQIEILDLFVFFSRLFLKSKYLSFVKEQGERFFRDPSEFTLKCTLFKICRTVIILTRSQMKFHTVLSTEDLRTINQGMLLPYKVRVPEK